MLDKHAKEIENERRIGATARAERDMLNHEAAGLRAALLATRMRAAVSRLAVSHAMRSVRVARLGSPAMALSALRNDRIREALRTALMWWRLHTADLSAHTTREERGRAEEVLGSGVADARATLAKLRARLGGGSGATADSKSTAKVKREAPRSGGCLSEQQHALSTAHSLS